MPVSNELDISKYVDIFLKYKWHGLIPAFMIVVVLTIGSFFLPKVYESTCIVEVDSGTIDNPLRNERAQPVRLGDHLMAFRQNALKWDVLSRVVDSVGTDAILENSDVYNANKLKKKLKLMTGSSQASAKDQVKKESVTGLLRNMIKTTHRPPRFLVLTCRGTHSDVNANILNTLVSILIEEREKLALSQVGRSFQFLKGEAENYRRKLEEAEARLKEFKEHHVTELPNNMNSNLAQLRTDESDMLARELELTELTRKLQYIDETLEKQSKLIVSEIRRETNPMLIVLNQRIVDMEIELTRLRSNYTELHPRVTELKGQLEDLKSQRDEVKESTMDTETSMLNPAYQRFIQEKQDTLVRIEGLKSRLRSLDERIKENEKKVRGMPAQEQQLLTLTRNYEVNANIYNMFLQELEEAKIQEKLASEARDRQTFRTIQYARATLTPVAPERPRLLMMIALVGMGTAIGIITIFNFFDDSLKSIEEAKDFIGKPLLGTVPSLDDRGNNGSLSLHEKLFKAIGKS